MGIWFAVEIDLHSPVSRNGDFNAFRAGATLVGTGRLFDPASIAEVETRYHEPKVFFARLPFFALLFKPFCWLPWSWGAEVWRAFNILAFFGSFLLWPIERRVRFLPVVCWSWPAAVLFNFGQDTALFLLCATAALVLLIRNRDLEAGLALSLCSIKFNLALALPVALIAARRWRALAGAAAGGAAILGVSFLLEGPGWPLAMAAVTRRPRFDPAIWLRPNLAGVVDVLRLPLAVEIALAVLVLAAVWLIARRAKPETAMMAALAAGLLVSHHAHVYDCILLVPLLVFMVRAPRPLPIRVWTFLLISPLPYAMVMDQGTSPFGRIFIVASVAAMLAVLVRQCWSRPAAGEATDSPVAPAAGRARSAPAV